MYCNKQPFKTLEPTFTCEREFFERLFAFWSFSIADPDITLYLPDCFCCISISWESSWTSLSYCSHRSFSRLFFLFWCLGPSSSILACNLFPSSARQLLLHQPVCEFWNDSSHSHRSGCQHGDGRCHWCGACWYSGSWPVSERHLLQGW